MASSSGHTEDGRLWDAYESNGRRFRVCDSWDVAMRLREMLSDDVLDDSDKAALMQVMVLPDPEAFASATGDAARDTLLDLMWQAFGFDLDGSHRSEPQVMDWDEDSDRIDATMLSAYGLEPSRWEQMSYLEVSRLIGLAPHETPMGQALYYRTAKRPKRTKYNKAEVEAFDKAHDFYRLGRHKDANKSATEAFDRVRRAVTNG